jgi:hypothetical protein
MFLRSLKPYLCEAARDGAWHLGVGVRQLLRGALRLLRAARRVAQHPVGLLPGAARSLHSGAASARITFATARAACVAAWCSLRICDIAGFEHALSMPGYRGMPTWAHVLGGLQRVRGIVLQLINRALRLQQRQT